MFVLQVDKNKIKPSLRETLTSGSIGVYKCLFEFSMDWDELQKVAVFRAGETYVTVDVDENNMVTIPWEVLTTPDIDLYVGVRGYAGQDTEEMDDDIVLPTIWLTLGTIRHGAELGGEPQPPTPGAYEQILIELSWLKTNKQDKLIGKPGEVVGFDDDGNAVAVQMPKLYRFGHGLKVEDEDTVVVDAVDDFKGDNTLPMTAAGVETIVGNIEALLASI